MEYQRLLIFQPSWTNERNGMKCMNWIEDTEVRKCIEKMWKKGIPFANTFICDWIRCSIWQLIISFVRWDTSTKIVVSILTSRRMATNNSKWQIAATLNGIKGAERKKISSKMNETCNCIKWCVFKLMANDVGP